MEKREKVLQYRKRLDSTLGSPKFTGKDSVRALVKSQLIRSSPSGEFEGDLENVVEKHTTNVWNLLEMMRSVPGNESEAVNNQSGPKNDWKLKKDDGQLRVMYREGPEGTPYHTLLAEGYVNGPIDVCLCISWESDLYFKWWPEATIPPFKVIMATCLKKIRVGEEISLVRMKVPWPLSMREVIVHYFELEFYEDGLILVLFNSFEKEHIDVSINGFTSDGIPDPKDAVRMDLVGGFALQKVSSEKSYFRTIANLDMKIEFMPPSLINFVARQLVGNGFKLYEKAIASAAKGDKDFDKVLEDGPLYFRIRKGMMNLEEPVDDVYHSGRQHSSGLTDEQAVGVEKSPRINGMHVSEIEEDDEQVIESSFVVPCTSESSGKEKEAVSGEVELALKMLDTAICLVREHARTFPSPIQAINALGEMGTSNTRVNGSEPKEAEVHSEEINWNVIVNNVRDHKVEPDESSLPNFGGVREKEVSPCADEVVSVPDTTNKPDPDNSRKVFNEVNMKTNGIHKGRYSPFRRKMFEKRHRICCLNLV